MRQARNTLIASQGQVCAMPDCDEPWTDIAHIDASGMGGRPSTNVVENLAGLCRTCHDIFDGRTMQGRQRMMRALLRSHVTR